MSNTADEKMSYIFGCANHRSLFFNNATTLTDYYKKFDQIANLNCEECRKCPCFRGNCLYMILHGRSIVPGGEKNVQMNKDLVDYCVEKGYLSGLSEHFSLFIKNITEAYTPWSRYSVDYCYMINKLLEAGADPFYSMPGYPWTIKSVLQYALKDKDQVRRKVATDVLGCYLAHGVDLRLFYTNEIYPHEHFSSKDWQNILWMYIERGTNLSALYTNVGTYPTDYFKTFCSSNGETFVFAPDGTFNTVYSLKLTEDGLKTTRHYSQSEITQIIWDYVVQLGSVTKAYAEGIPLHKFVQMVSYSHHHKFENYYFNPDGRMQTLRLRLTADGFSD